MLKRLDDIRDRNLEKSKHEEELKCKEIQLSTMRNYILKNINIAQKIERIRINTVKSVTLSEQDWSEIRMFVDSMEGDFVARLRNRYPTLNKSDTEFMILLRLKMPSKAMGLIYGISEKSIRQKQFVYKTKVGIENNKHLSLRSFIEQF